MKALISVCLWKLVLAFTAVAVLPRRLDAAMTSLCLTGGMRPAGLVYQQGR